MFIVPLSCSSSEIANLALVSAAEGITAAFWAPCAIVG
jgi:hypothetical protein